MITLIRRFCRLFVLVSIWAHSTRAQPYSARNLSLAQGLPEYYVSGLAQDKAGFIWVATRDGLARYDGHTFKIFRHQPNQPNSLAYNVILSLQQASDSTILLTLENGELQLFNPVTEVFKRAFSGKSIAGLYGSLISADERWLWGRNDSTLTLLDRRTYQTRAYQIDKFKPSGNASISTPFLASEPHRLYAAVTGELIELDTRTHQHYRWPCAAIGEEKQKDTYYAVPMAQRSTSELIIGGIHQLVSFNPITHRFRSIPIPSQLATQVSIICAAADGNVYFGYGMTLYRLASDNRITPIWTAPRIDYLNYFRSILVDRSGVCWLGTNGDGIQQIDLRSLPFKAYPYKKDFAYDLLTGEAGFPDQTWTSIDICYRLRFASSSKLYMTGWIRHACKLYQGDPIQRTFRPILPLAAQQSLGNSDAIRVLPNGQILFYGSSQGVIQTDSTGRVIQKLPVYVLDVSDFQPVGSRLWVASQYHGLYAYDQQMKRIRYHFQHNPADPHSLPTHNVQCLALDPTNPSVLWIGMLGEGLCRLDSRTLRYRIFTEKDGLPNATIQALLPDRKGNLWFSTLKGISQLNPKTGQMRHFTKEDGLQDIEYKLHHAAQLPDGRMAFGGLTGMTVFDPLSIGDDSFEVPTSLVSLKVNNRSVEAGQIGSPLTLPLNSTQTLTLKYNQNFLTFDFAGLQFNKPGKLQYRYQLDGVDESWVYAGGQNSANYTQLAPGDYQFRVNATNTGGRWSPLTKTLRIVISPPWWATWWAYLGYGLLVLSVVWQFTQVRIKRVTAQREAQQLRALDQMKTRFFTNITHELRTPLTLIAAPVEALLAELAATSYSKSLVMIQRNARHLLHLINQLLDLARLDAQFMLVQPARGELARFVEQTVRPFIEQTTPTGPKIHLQTDAAGEYWFDADKLESILTNLVANAVKFTPPDGQINVTLEPRAGGVQLTVADTGIGIAADQLPYIFERFYRIEPDASGRHNPESIQPGTGIGLSLVEELVRLQRGQIQVQSQPDQGTRFEVFLPYSSVESTADPASAPTSVVEPTPLATTESYQVLIVEDNEELAQFIQDCLPAHFQVSQAPNGRAGLQLAQTYLPDLIISDVMMPLMDGYTLVKHLKDDERTNHIPVILLTAKASFDNRMEGLAMGADEYLTKPFHVDELRLRVENLLTRQRRFQERVQAQLRQPRPTASAQSPSVEDKNPFLLHIYALMNQHLSDSTLSVEELANQLQLDRSSLHRKVKALTGITPSELMRAYRLKQAALRLSQGLGSKETAYQTGFDSPAYFTKCFREQYGMTPTEFARNPSNTQN